MVNKVVNIRMFVGTTSYVRTIAE